MMQIRQTERRLKVLKLLRHGTSETDIAIELHFSRNTIVRDVRWLRQNIIYDFKLITNEILQELESRVGQMSNTDLINFLGKLIPRKIEAKTEITEHLDARIQLEVNEDEDAILNKAASILNRKLSNKKKLAEVHH